MQSICRKTQPSRKLIEGGDFLTVTPTKSKRLFEKTVHHRGAVWFPNQGARSFLNIFLKVF